MDTKEYTVTKRAGPKVAGRPVKKGETIDLTTHQAEAELLAGAIVPKGKDGEEVKDPLAGTKRLAGIHARAKGEDDDTDAAIEAAAPDAPPAGPTGAGDPPPAAQGADGASVPKASGRKAAAGAQG